MFTSIKDKIGKLFIIINLISSIIFVFLLFIIYRFYFNYFYENMKNSFLIFHNYISNNLVINENSEIDYKSLQRDMSFFMQRRVFDNYIIYDENFKVLDCFNKNDYSKEFLISKINSSDQYFLNKDTFNLINKLEKAGVIRYYVISKNIKGLYYYRNLLFFIFLLFIFLNHVIIYLFLQYKIRKIIIYPIDRLIKYTNDIASGEFDIEPTIFLNTDEDIDELGLLLKNLDEMKVNLNLLWEQLKRSEAKYKIIFENSNDGLCLVDSEDRFLMVNKKLCDLLGYSIEEIIYKKSSSFVWSNEDYEKIRRENKKRERGFSSLFDINFRSKTGSKVHALVSAAPLFDGEKFEGSIAIISDRSNLGELENKFNFSLKVETLGKLIGGIAHNFNNLLTGIIGYSGLIKLKNKDEKINEYIENIINLSNSQAELVSKLLGFSKQGKYVLEDINLNDIIKEELKFLQQIKDSKNIKFVCDLESDLYNVHGDKGQLEQVIYNLLTNSISASYENGIIEIRTRNVYITGHDYVEVSIKDYGHGIPQEHKNKIFEPYFTTKDTTKDKGAGLGLAMAYGVITNHGGTITFESEEGKGSTFWVRLPSAF